MRYVVSKDQLSELAFRATLTDAAIVRGADPDAAWALWTDTRYVTYRW